MATRLVQIFKDLDENKPAGSIRIRVETIDYFLRRYREQITQRRKAEKEIEDQSVQYATQLRQQHSRATASRSRLTEAGRTVARRHVISALPRGLPYLISMVAAELTLSNVLRNPGRRLPRLPFAEVGTQADGKNAESASVERTSHLHRTRLYLAR